MTKNTKKVAEPNKLRLSPQARMVLSHLSTAGTITQREALMDHSVQSLTRRITEIRDEGFKVVGVWKKHPTTGQRYMRYSFNG
jgi:hypothetical protein